MRCRLAMLAAASLGALALIGCEPATGTIAVSAVTDLEPGVDFVGVEVEAFRDELRVGHAERIVEPGDWTEPAPIADLPGLPYGPLRLVLTLYAARRELVVTRTVELELDGLRALTMVLASSCVRVVCPGAGDPPDATTCAGGVCVSPGCGADCGLCGGDDDCAPSAVCGAGRCVEGTCIYPDGAAACPDGEACHPERGCESATCDCDDADPCTRDLCQGSLCVHAPRDGVPCDDGSFCNGDDRCVAGVCENVGPAPCDRAACDEPTRTCTVGCETAADCPSDVIGAFGDCVYDGECAETGERARTVTRFTCVDRECTPMELEETEACTRTTAGSPCGSGDGCTDWTGCRYAECATEGLDARRCTTESCVAGVCRASSWDETMPCSRGSQDGLPCDASTGYGTCRGTCAGTECADLCAYCGGYCAIVGCYADGTACPAP